MHLFLFYNQMTPVTRKKRGVTKKRNHFCDSSFLYTYILHDKYDEISGQKLCCPHFNRLSIDSYNDLGRAKGILTSMIDLQLFCLRHSLDYNGYSFHIFIHLHLDHTVSCNLICSCIHSSIF